MLHVKTAHAWLGSRSSALQDPLLEQSKQSSRACSWMGACFWWHKFFLVLVQSLWGKSAQAQHEKLVTHSKNKCYCQQATITMYKVFQSNNKLGYNYSHSAAGIHCCPLGRWYTWCYNHHADFWEAPARSLSPCFPQPPLGLMDQRSGLRTTSKRIYFPSVTIIFEGF